MNRHQINIRTRDGDGVFINPGDGFADITMTVNRHTLHVMWLQVATELASIDPQFRAARQEADCALKDYEEEIYRNHQTKGKSCPT